MKFIFLGLLFTLSSSLELNGQDLIGHKIWKLYPSIAGFETKVYVSKKDTCIYLMDLLSIDFQINSSDSILIESNGIRPIKTSIENLINDKVFECVSIYNQIPKYELSKRRAYKYYDKIKYKCIENFEPEAVTNEQIQGLYRHVENYFLWIKENELIVFEEIENGYHVRVGEFEIINDRLSTSFDQNFNWNTNKKELKKVKNQNYEESNFSIELCFLLNDCRQNHLTMIISMMSILESEESLEDFKEIMVKINKLIRESSC